MPDLTHTCFGYCARCRMVHSLPMGSATSAALALMRELDRHRRLDVHLPPEMADAQFSTGYLFGKAGGKMFGVLVCRRTDGKEMTLKAFSGQYNGRWTIDGWVPPVFDPAQWQAVNTPAEKEIKRLGDRIHTAGRDTFEATALVKRRKNQSRELMKQLHNLYILCNFRSQYRALSEVFSGSNGIPNGTADCCAPKLLHFAAVNDLVPLGLAEFYYGRHSNLGNRVHKRFYPVCGEKCAPILGYMLCGLDGQTARKKGDAHGPG